MSYLLRSLKRSLREINSIKSPWYIKVYDSADAIQRALKNKCGWYQIKAFAINLPFFIKMAWWWRPWDQFYVIESLAQQLERMGRETRKHGYHMNSETTARRCLTAAGMLRKAYNDEYILLDRSYAAWSRASKTDLKLDANTGYFQMVHDHPKGESYRESMFKVIHTRINANKKQRKADVWAYIHKHIDGFWS